MLLYFGVVVLFLFCSDKKGCGLELHLSGKEGSQRKSIFADIVFHSMRGRRRLKKEILFCQKGILVSVVVVVVVCLVLSLVQCFLGYLSKGTQSWRLRSEGKEKREREREKVFKLSTLLLFFPI